MEKIAEGRYKINNNHIYFFYNTKTHRYVISLNAEHRMTVTKAKGEVIKQFLDWLTSKISSNSKE